jgi:hypothetical protein
LIRKKVIASTAQAQEANALCSCLILAPGLYILAQSGVICSVAAIKAQARRLRQWGELGARPLLHKLIEHCVTPTAAKTLNDGELAAWPFLHKLIEHSATARATKMCIHEQRRVLHPAHKSQGRDFALESIFSNDSLLGCERKTELR